MAVDKFEKELKGWSANELYAKGMDYFYGRNKIQKDYEKALRCFIKALDFADVRAMEQIGYMYELGWGVGKDKKEALKWYRRAAEIGGVDLENCFAACLKESGDIAEAIVWLRKSAELGNKDAMHKLARLILDYEGNEPAAFEWLIRYNDGNEAAALASLAGLYYFEEPQKAFALYKAASDKGEDCDYILGSMYLKGKGVEKNVHEAIKYFQKAAQVAVSDDAASNYCKWDSMLKLAEIYISLKDELTALEWLTKRNDGNEIQGMGELAHIYYGDDDFEYEDASLIDREKAFEWFGKLYELKDPHGTYFFAEMWEAESRSKALQIYKDGVDFGSERCCKRIIQLYLEAGNISEASRWAVKYLDMCGIIADEKNALTKLEI